MAATTRATTVDTQRVEGRREIRYANFDELLADAERLESDGYRRLGNWSLGQTARHLAAGMNIALDGSPFKTLWWMRLLARTFFKTATLRKMKPGFKVPPYAARHMVPDATADAQGIEALRASIRRWKSEPQRHPQPYFGALTPAEWDQLALRHADMHMSFLLPKSSA